MSRSKTQTLSEALADVPINAPRQRLVDNWKEMVPPGSMWRPGYPGDPNCSKCLGLGYIRMDLPIHAPMFGRLIICDCVKEPARSDMAQRIDKLLKAE